MVDGLGSRLDGVQRHLRRYMPFYVFGAVWLLMIAVLPTNAPRGDDVNAGFSFGGPGAVGDTGVSGGDAAGGTGHAGAQAGGGGPAGAGGAAAPVGAAGKAGGQRAAASGATRGGFPCGPGQRQLPWSTYAAPCIPHFTGQNGGATWRGVEPETIKIVSRTYNVSPQRAAVDAVADQAGLASSEDTARMRRVFVDYFNKVYELYGRKVVIEDFTSNGNELEEVQNRGREQACADATAIAQERKAFAVIPHAASLSYGPFSECSAEQKLVVPIGAYGFPESWYRKHHPYTWGLQMTCDRISYLLTEYIEKRLDGNARWAKDPVYKTQPRKFGSIEPDVAAYQPCLDITDRELKRQGTPIVSRFKYAVDPSRMSAQAAQAVVQFKAAGVNTLILSSDFLMTINLTRQAANQNWGPEWLMIGAGLQDVDNTSRLYDQSVVDGAMFGMSQLGATAAMRGPESEPVTTYKRITGQDPPKGTDGSYYQMVYLFNALQGAGPNLNPQTFAAAFGQLPQLGPPRLDNGMWFFRTNPDGSPGGDHTAVDDSREVYWDGRAPGFDGGTGAYVATYGGRRFTNGQWPREPPPFPAR